ncbi:MAG: DNA polymerase III subunit epsilon [Steroidobacteraceae bacterium]
MRQVVLDTETTGLEVELQHRVIEIGCVEIFNRRLTGRHFHRYLNPERDIDEGAVQVHGLTRQRLAKEPTFAQIRTEFLEFVRDAELIIHNAAFDVAFLNAELGRGAESSARIGDLCRVLDTLALARQMHPGQRNSLDALCKRYSVDNSRRDYHGALLDARLLAEVYLSMTGGQAAMVLNAEPDPALARSRLAIAVGASAAAPLVVITANDEELEAHEQVLALLDKASSGKTVWRTL